MSTETGTTARIRWTAVECGTVASWFGYAGTAEQSLFSILHPVTSKPSRYRYDEWALGASFPGAQNETRYATTREPEAAVAELKAEAERWLEEHVRSLGAVFPGTLRSEVESMRADKHQLAGDHDWQAERAYGAVETLDWALSAIDRMTAVPAANPAPAGEE